MTNAPKDKPVRYEPFEDPRTGELLYRPVQDDALLTPMTPE